jgi:hypothetical protein
MTSTANVVAEAFDVPWRGTVGLVLPVRRSRMSASARDAFEKLRAGGMLLSDWIVLDVLGEVGGLWARESCSTPLWSCHAPPKTAALH